MTTDSFVIGQLALLAWQEGRRSSVNLMNALMLTLANRVEHGMWLDEIAAQRVIYSPWSREHRLYIWSHFPDIRDPVFQGALHSAEAVYEGALDILTDGAKYYAPLGDEFYDQTGWFQKNIVEQYEKHPRTATISGWSFYK